MTFSKRIKEELCRNNYSIGEKKAILSSFLKNIILSNEVKNKIIWEIKSKTPLTIRFIGNLLTEIYNIEKNISISKKTNNTSRIYKLEIFGDFEFIKKDLCFFDNRKSIFETPELKCAYLIGLFLTGGSINSPSSSNYHFEISLNNLELLKEAIEIFDFFNIKSFWMKRKNKYLIYVKKSENISDILKLIGASNSMFEFEEKRIYRDYSNQMSRLNNLDISNLKKTAIASHEQVQYIKYLKDNNLYNQLNEKEKIFCELRLNNEEASLMDLVHLFKSEHNIEITRTGINHFVRKIKKIYKENKKS